MAKGTEVKSAPRIFGGTNVYSTAYNNISYRTRLDSGDPFSAGSSKWESRAPH